MSDELDDLQPEDAAAIDPPNNTEGEPQMSPMDSEPSPVDPPNNT